MLSANMILLIVVGLIFLVTMLDRFLIPFLQKKGYLNDKTAQSVKQVIGVAELILDNMSVSKKAKDLTDMIFGFSNAVVKHVEQTMPPQDNAKKKEVAVESVINMLKSLDIEVTESIEKLIDTAIESAVFDLPSTNK